MGDYDICPECGAVYHGNMFCGTCRRVQNKRHGWNLPPYNHPAVPPCGANDINRFIAKVEYSKLEYYNDGKKEEES